MLKFFKKVKHIFLVGCLLLITHALFSQENKITHFSEDSVKFYQEMEDFMRNADNKIGKDIMNEFELVWYGGKFSEAERKNIYKTANFMLKKKLNALPFFKSYLTTLIGFTKGNQDRQSLEAWESNLEKLMSGKNIKELQGYLEFSSSFFEENAIFKSNTTKWVVDAKNYSFEFSDKPFLVFPSLTLKCYSKGDSAIIHNTSGIYFPTEDRWEGKKGMVDWKRAGFDDKQVFAELKKYVIDTKGSDYEADSVIFHNSFYFNKPILGKLTEKILANATPENASYPQVVSYDKRIKITNIVQDVDYDGGFTQKGSKFIGSGDETEDALLIFYKKNKPFIITAAKAYTIRPDKIISKDVKFKMFLEDDSISHPNVDLNLRIKDRSLSIIRTEEGLSKTPFFNTYHQVDMYFEQIKWKLDEPSVTFGPLEGTVISEALLESKDYYQQVKFDKIMGIDDRHPLSIIINCSRKNDNAKTLTLAQLTKAMGVSETSAKIALLKLSTLGFLEYDLSKDVITIKDKLTHYVYSNAKKEDYDVIQFNSSAKDGKINAILNLLNNEVRMEGVETVLLSDSQRVFVYPTDKKIVLRKNRDFVFSGVVNAGGFEYFGKEYLFEYEKFKINMPNTDSARVYVMVGEKDERGYEIESMVKSTIEHINGELLIDNPGNKSGVKSIAKYPVFKSFGNSYVYYDAKKIFNGVYNRDKFYFQIKPFEFDSLDNFPSASLNFDGSFSSSDIFPVFDEQLTLMSDLSLGFSRKTPTEGFPTYKGKGNYTNEINLSNRGLRGDGILTYITSTIESKDYMFFPDSMNTIAQHYDIEERMSGIELPPVSGKDVKIHWEPYKDFMNVSHTDKPIAMYDGSRFFGTLTNKPGGLTGNGMVAFQKAEIESNLLKFKFTEFDADTAEFRLKTAEDAAQTDVLSFATNNVKAHIDFKQRKGEFIANGGGSFVEFPMNQYIAFMDKFTWYMESEDIELSATTKVKDEQQGVQLEGSEFISTHPQQDSLRFYSNAARYDTKNHIITARQVKYINVADALIYPDSEKVVIRKAAEMETLKNAQILANSTNKYHKIYNATLNIGGRYKYGGSGYYDYKDENKKSQSLYFADIHVDSSRQTVAKGTVAVTDNFTLSPNYEYKGDVILNASQKNLTFDGNGRLAHNCEMIPRSWFRFKGEIEPEDIYIPIDSILRNDEKNPIVSSIMIKNDSAHIYPRFIGAAKKYSDVEMVHSAGYLYFDKKESTYKISNLPKINEISLPGNYVSLNTSTCKMYAEGKMNLGVDFGAASMNPVGNVNYFPTNDSTIVDAMILFDFFMENSAMDNMAKQIRKFDGLEGVNFDRDVFERGLQEYVGKETGDKLISQLNLYGEYKRFPDELNKALFINDVKFRWNPITRSFQSFGKIGVGNIYKSEINKYVEGQIEIVKKRSGDILTINLELDDSQWYFFNYTRDIMYVLSSKEDFNKIIKDTKSDKRKLKYDKGKTYAFQLGSPKKRNDFLRKFKSSEATEEAEEGKKRKGKDKDD